MSFEAGGRSLRRCGRKGVKISHEGLAGNRIERARHDG